MLDRPSVFDCTSLKADKNAVEVECSAIGMNRERESSTFQSFMAILLTGQGNRFQQITPGERRLSQRLQEKLDDDALIWFNAPIGRRRLHPDFIVLHPSRGLLVLEVKDWQIDTIEQITPSTVTLITPDEPKEVENSLVLQL